MIQNTFRGAQFINGLKLFLLSIAFVFANSLPAQNLSNLSFGTDSTFEVMTWNIEWFPKQANTIDSVITIIQALAIDVIAIQEIDDEEEFEMMVEELDGWEGYSIVSDYLEMGYIYNSTSVEVDSIYEILTDNSRVLPRPTLVMEVTWNNEQYYILNNHLKCCGDGYMNTANLWDEEVRRRDACIYIENYISTNWPDEKVILLGDLNDLIQENENNNVFQVFLDAESSYRFLDMEIAEGDGGDWSYPSWPSHLDHILISDELFDEFDLNNGVIETIKIEDYLPNGFSDYDYYLSDHRPLAIKIFPSDISTSINEKNKKAVQISIYPNPASETIFIETSTDLKDVFIEIYSLDGTLIDIETYSTVSFIEYSTSKLGTGTFLLRVIVDNKPSITKKIFIK